MNKQVIKEYCIGCGLCQSEGIAKLNRNEKGFYYPSKEDINRETESFFEKVCPSSGQQLKFFDTTSIWGKREQIYAAYATEKDVRRKASSGGVLTALCSYLLREKKVDGIIHVGVADGSPFETKCYCSTTVEEVVSRCGSRYAISAPLLELSTLVEEGRRYAFIGKPCDIIALRGFMQNENKYSNIIYLLSFFCAGLPSNEANRLLLKRLGCEEEKCSRLTYRGEGWPGCATAEDEEGKKHTMSYSESWGGILGRDVNPYCKFCMDGIGEMADISCGDGWYLNNAMQPDFSEREGRNVVFTRSPEGEALFREAVRLGYICAELWEKEEHIKYIQKYQHTRRSTMRVKLLAFRLLGREVPNYSKYVVKCYEKDASVKQRIKIFAGTVKRILQRRV